MTRVTLITTFVLFLVLGACKSTTDNNDTLDVYIGGEISSVQFIVIGPGSVKLTWVENFPDESGFYVDRKLWNGNWEKKIQHVSANVTEAIDTTAVLGNVYYYKVYAHKGDAESTEEQVQYNFYLPYPYNVDYDFSWTNPTHIRFFWTNQAVWADSIVVAKRISGSEWTQHYAVLPGSSTEYTDFDYNVSNTTDWGFTAYYGEDVSQQALITMMPPKK